MEYKIDSKLNDDAILKDALELLEFIEFSPDLLLLEMENRFHWISTRYTSEKVGCWIYCVSTRKSLIYLKLSWNVSIRQYKDEQDAADIHCHNFL